MKVVIEVPKALSLSSRLQYPQLNLCNIPFLPKWLSEFEDLQTLIISQSGLKVFPPFLMDMPNLERVHLFSNPGCTPDIVPDFKRNIKDFECSLYGTSAKMNTSGQEKYEVCIVPTNQWVHFGEHGRGPRTLGKDPNHRVHQ